MSRAPLQYLGGTGLDTAAVALAVFVINGSNFVKQKLVLCADGGQNSYGQIHATFG